MLTNLTLSNKMCDFFPPLLQKFKLMNILTCRFRMFFKWYLFLNKTIYFQPLNFLLNINCTVTFLGGKWIKVARRLRLGLATAHFALVVKFWQADGSLCKHLKNENADIVEGKFYPRYSSRILFWFDYNCRKNKNEIR